MKRFNIMIMMLVALGIVGFTVATASGDIYSWTDENGVRYFTNHAPPKQAKLLMKTPEIPYDEEADNQRREMDRLEIAKQELAEREAFLVQQQQEAERRIAEANAKADAALREADQILQDAEAAAEEPNYYRSSSYGYGYGSRYLYKGYYRYNGSLYYKRHHYKHKGHHYKYKRHHRLHRNRIIHHSKRPHHNRYQPKHRVRSHHSLYGGRYTSHRSRVGTFRGRHGRF